jgi:hypothetical protein
VSGQWGKLIGRVRLFWREVAKTSTRRLVADSPAKGPFWGDIHTEGSPAEEA